MSSPPERIASSACIGADIGATLIKLARRRRDGSLGLRLVADEPLAAVAGQIAAARPARVGLTGGGAPELATQLRAEISSLSEFEAWRSGAEALLARDGLAVARRYLLVSLGTGTSAMLVDGKEARRVGGTALGGGTFLGLGAALVGKTSFADLVALARRGDRRRVDLLVSEIYRSGAPPLPGDVNAASFAKLAHGSDAERPAASDLAHALLGLVGENVGLICCALASASDVRAIVFGGATLRDNPVLREILHGLTRILGHEPTFLRDGEFAGAVGALLAAERHART